ncbi:eukaryotic initiation factor 4A [Salpingoeca rosetta]|uniref:Eukaryotic initiation factor 4A n=1 Tax=Salpingoeca rosetta (strain ATCC 50818 / BSB-021) TaxID=946362 RepID=F2TYM6_SALR5|nr:eukaryotic initiation factor 4A [Salpingoeca rosetta]EGD78700.1 eukaryotic initiation factor 4A [Salpingoeca rosetta]|eukprot:XP_004997657.1 eukaryotic initiation factor 4A [Salpingoeca rosetta]
MQRTRTSKQEEVHVLADTSRRAPAATAPDPRGDTAAAKQTPSTPCWDPNSSESSHNASHADAATLKQEQHDVPDVETHKQDGDSVVPAGTGHDPVQIIDTFDDMNLSMELLRGVYAYGYEAPTAIQQRAIVPISSGRDIIVQAPSGMGKTATFSIGSLQRVDTTLPSCQLLVLSPTRELAIQTADACQSLGSYVGVRVLPLIGGQSVRDQRTALREDGIHVVCGTPGRVKHMLSDDSLDCRQLTTIVLDEADELLEYFQDDIYDVFQFVPRDAQVVLVTATTTDVLLKISKKVLRNPVNILVKPEELRLEGIQHFFVDVQQHLHKYPTLCDLYNSLNTAQTVVFVNRRRTALELEDRLVRDKFAVSVIHGEMEQDERIATLDRFRSGQSRVLVATNVVARGIDVQQVSLVINYDVPLDRESYIHRAGRGGRQGRKGVTINLVTQEDARFLRDIESFYSIAINELPADLSILQL